MEKSCRKGKIKGPSLLEPPNLVDIGAILCDSLHVGEKKPKAWPSSVPSARPVLTSRRGKSYSFQKTSEKGK